MTERTVIECDGNWCDPTEEAHPSTFENSNEWASFEVDDTERHLCPECSWRTLQWAVNGRSGGDYFAVKHSNIGEDFEEAHISPGITKDNVSKGGTQSMHVHPFLDERNEYPDYDPEQDEAWHFHVHDHLGITIIGQHKGEPIVYIDSDEFPTHLVIEDSERSFESVSIGANIASETDISVKPVDNE